MKKVLAITALAVIVAGVAAGSAAAKTTRPCSTAIYPPATLSVRGMECAEGKATIRTLFTAHPGGDGVGFNQKRSFRIKGWAGSPVKTHRTFVCSVIYTSGTGANRGGIMLKVTCHDFNGDAVYYTEQQDNE